MNWTIEQRWSHAAFLNWKVPESTLQAQVPFPLDLHEGQAVLSLVPFYMDQIRFRGLPRVPFFSSLWELNLRTYVRVNGVPGIYFFTLETPHRLGNFIARTFFDLPYRKARITAKVGENDYRFQAIGRLADQSNYDLALELETGSAISTDPFQTWITERYHLFIKKGGLTIRGDVQHEPWQTSLVSVRKLQGGISILPALPPLPELAPCFLGEPLRVRFSPFQIQDNQRAR
ncbi:MAG: DUF2071 domain-containing protein [Bdellovibrionales bacterium]|nr:DUF2071 domain-containing protein [Bdellovibrionales bacterium]